MDTGGIKKERELKQEGEKDSTRGIKSYTQNQNTTATDNRDVKLKKMKHITFSREDK